LKTKAYSTFALAKDEEEDEMSAERREAHEWISRMLSALSDQIETLDGDIEILGGNPLAFGNAAATSSAETAISVGGGPGKRAGGGGKKNKSGGGSKSQSGGGGNHQDNSGGHNSGHSNNANQYNNSGNSNSDNPNQAQIDEKLRHKEYSDFHVKKLELLLRSLNNDTLDVSLLENVKDGLEYFLECELAEYYHDETMYDCFDEAIVEFAAEQENAQSKTVLAKMGIQSAQQLSTLMQARSGDDNSGGLGGGNNHSSGMMGGNNHSSGMGGNNSNSGGGNNSGMGGGGNNSGMGGGGNNSGGGGGNNSGGGGGNNSGGNYSSGGGGGNNSNNSSHGGGGGHNSSHGGGGGNNSSHGGGGGHNSSHGGGNNAHGNNSSKDHSGSNNAINNLIIDNTTINNIIASGALAGGAILGADVGENPLEKMMMGKKTGKKAAAKKGIINPAAQKNVNAPVVKKPTGEEYSEHKISEDQLVQDAEEFICKICYVHVVGCSPKLTKCSHLFWYST